MLLCRSQTIKKKTAAHPVLREHDTHYKHFHCFKNLSPLPPSQSEATQVYMVDFPPDAHPPQTLVAMVTSFNSLNNAIQALLVHADTLANEVCEFCDFADIVGSRTTVIQSSVMFFREFPCTHEMLIFTNL